MNDLEAAVQPDEEGVVGGGLEDVLLGLHPVDVLVVRHQLLLDHLHGVDALVLLQLHHQYLQQVRGGIQIKMMYLVASKG